MVDREGSLASRHHVAEFDPLDLARWPLG